MPKLKNKKYLLAAVIAVLASVMQFHHHDSEGHTFSIVAETIAECFGIEDDHDDCHNHSGNSECEHCTLTLDLLADASDDNEFNYKAHFTGAFHLDAFYVVDAKCSVHSFEAPVSVGIPFVVLQKDGYANVYGLRGPPQPQLFA